MRNRDVGREMNTSRLANAVTPDLPSVNPVMMNAASAGPSNPGSCVVLDPGAVASHSHQRFDRTATRAILGLRPGEKGGGTEADMTFVHRHPVVSFFVLAYGLSWAYWIPLALSGGRGYAR